MSTKPMTKLVFLLALSSTAFASTCYDNYGYSYYCRNRLSNGARIGIGIAVAVGGLILISLLSFGYRRRRLAQNRAYIVDQQGGAPTAGQYYPQQGQFNTGSQGYYPSGNATHPGAPNYPPQAHQGSFAPPPGSHPAQNGSFAGGFQPPAGPPPGGASPPPPDYNATTQAQSKYHAPPGPPPTR